MADDQIEARKAKRDLLRAQGVNPYPDRWARTHSLAEARALAEGADGLRVAGRVMAKREISKKLVFLTLQDASGRMQVSFRAGTLADASMDLMRKSLDVGDFLGVAGKHWVTKTGEPTIDASDVRILSKGLRPLPEKWLGVADRETCYRQRYLDLLTNDETRARFRMRTKLVRVIREYLDRHAFEEVETPVLQTKASGALAKPFLSHHNALDMDVTLRIAPETWLKRLLVGGYERVYEFARCFRNEGMDPSHLQDFTMLEYYVAYWSYEENMDFTEALVKHAVQECLGTTKVARPSPEGGTVEIDFGGTWPRRRITDLILERTGLDVLRDRDPAALRAWVREHGFWDDDVARMSWGSLVDHVYKKTVRPHLIQPTFIVGHPIELSPLARRNDADPTVTDRFQLVVNTWEVVNAYSELVDPDDQRRRFEEQAAARAGGDEEAMPTEEDYLLCMEYGMPPTSGWGMGIDRFVTLLSAQENLRDAVLFPLMRPL
jgi:lysyl-tRNA synthetase class 2